MLSESSTSAQIACLVHLHSVTLDHSVRRDASAANEQLCKSYRIKLKSKVVTAEAHVAAVLMIILFQLTQCWRVPLCPCHIHSQWKAFLANQKPERKCVLLFFRRKVVKYDFPLDKMWWITGSENGYLPNILWFYIFQYEDLLLFSFIFGFWNICWTERVIWRRHLGLLEILVNFFHYHPE